MFEQYIAAAGPLRREVLREAETWLGTPYRHQASCKGAGCDCLGLVRGIWRALIGPEPQSLPAYSADWAEAAGAETLLAAGRRWLVEQDPTKALPGDVLVFRWRAGARAKHAGILAPGNRLVHAYERVGVVQSPLASAWRRRIAAAFSFPEVPSWQP
ncbi:NlpC/P60 family protein [Roseibium hamelinense]|uniref:NlpC/P60 family protein n=1 Tax=Roseibium hamelinense TaxID=150831 RepID=UPI003137B0AA